MRKENTIEYYIGRAYLYLGSRKINQDTAQDFIVNLLERLNSTIPSDYDREYHCWYCMVRRAINNMVDNEVIECFINNQYAYQIPFVDIVLKNEIETLTRARFSERDNEIFYLRIYNGLSFGEISELIGISDERARVVTYSIINYLRRNL